MGEVGVENVDNPNSFPKHHLGQPLNTKLGVSPEHTVHGPNSPLLKKNSGMLSRPGTDQAQALVPMHHFQHRPEQQQDQD